MNVVFRNRLSLEQYLGVKEAFPGNPSLTTKYFQTMGVLIVAESEADLLAMNSLDFKMLKNTGGLYQVRINGQYRIRFYLNENTIEIEAVGEFH